MSGTTVVPKIEIDVSGTSPRSSSPSYTDLSAYCLSFDTKRGRTSELDELNAGAGSVLLDNTDRRFDPTYTSGPYYPNLVPMTKVRLSATLTGVTYRVFTSYATAWPTEKQGPSWSEVALPLVDGFGPLQLANLAATFAQELTSVRVGNVLDQIGFPAGDRTIGAGISLCAAVTYAATGGQTAGAHIAAVEQTENGLFFFAGDGTAHFVPRRTLLGASTSLATFDDGNTATLDYEDARGDYSDKLIYNTVTVTDSAGTAATSTDTTSQGQYWPRSLSRSTLLPSGSTETADAASYLKSVYKQPGFRFESLTFLAGMNDTMMLEALTREIGDRITVKQTQPGSGPQISQDCIVQSIAHHYDPTADNIWTTTYELAPAANTGAWWKLGTSQLGISTQLGY